MQDGPYRGSGYAQAHERIRNMKAGVCGEPGCPRVDLEIALIHGRGQFADETGVHAGTPYSEEPDDYVQLCRSHHRLYDLAIEGATARQLVGARAAIPVVACERCGRAMPANCLPNHARFCGKPKPLCLEPDCIRIAKSRGWCGTHYERWRKHGDAHTVGVSSGQFRPGNTPHNASRSDS